MSGTKPKARFGNRRGVHEVESSDEFDTNCNTVEDDNNDCGKCNKLVKDNQNGLQCELCYKWYHCGCVKVSKDEYKSICEMKGKVLWLCISCKGNCKSVNKENRKLKKENEALMDIVANLTNRLERIEDKLDRQANCDELELDKKIEEHVSEHFEREKKKTNLIIFGVEESNSEDGYERKQYDNDCCKELFQVLEIKEVNRKVDVVYRLGRKNQGEDGNVGEGAGNGERAVRPRPRPLLIKMENEKLK